MKRVKYILLFLILLSVIVASSQQKTKFIFGLKTKYIIYPGIKIYHQEGVDIMKSRIAGAWMFGVDMQWDYLQKGRSIVLSMSVGTEPNLKTLSMDWDKVGSLIMNSNESSYSWMLLDDNQPVVHFRLDYKYYLFHHCMGPYLFGGLALIMPMGINENTKIIYQKIDGDIYSFGSMITNNQAHNEPYTPFYPGLRLGGGFRRNIAFLSFDFSLGIMVFKHYYTGTYESTTEVPFYTKGTYSQRNYLFELGLSIFYNRQNRKK